jgi:3-(3-hydroxy-phenyl)propionate hydroxylase
VVGFDSPTFRAVAGTALPSGMNGAILGLVRRDDDFLPARSSAGIVIARDVDGDLAAWLDRKAAAAVVLRPDRYTYRLLDEAELDALVALRAPQVLTGEPYPSPAAAIPN